MEGLEPPHLTASDPKSDVSTNFTTSGRAKPKIRNQTLTAESLLAFMPCYLVLFNGQQR